MQILGTVRVYLSLGSSVAIVVYCILGAIQTLMRPEEAAPSTCHEGLHYAPSQFTTSLDAKFLCGPSVLGMYTRFGWNG